MRVTEYTTFNSDAISGWERFKPTKGVVAFGGGEVVTTDLWEAFPGCGSAPSPSPLHDPGSPASRCRPAVARLRATRSSKKESFRSHELMIARIASRRTLAVSWWASARAFWSWAAVRSVQ
ncbi:hypothetical protein [Nonomuraea salmonea]|uniref:hypothetical protein n=1 Tax=Nonomuraea salmonea TaxID=46181 RepID=UPI0031EC0DF3